MSQEQPSTANERKHPRWEMQLDWGDLLVAVLERKTIPEDDPNYPTERFLFCRREFQAQNGDRISIQGVPIVRDPGDEDRVSMWIVKVDPGAASNSHAVKLPKTTFQITAIEANGEAYGASIKDGDQEFPVSSDMLEALFTTAAGMTPITATEYELPPDRG